MATLDQFAIRMRRRAALVESGGPRAKRLVAGAILQAVVPATPVDTGRARSNWFVGVVNPIRRTIDGYGKEGGNVALGNGTSTINTVTGHEDIWLSNNLDYINALNDGSSRQAPAGFVEQAVQIGRAVMRGYRLMD